MKFTKSLGLLLAALALLTVPAARMSTSWFDVPNPGPHDVPNPGPHDVPNPGPH
jgi:hypothetical protein